MYLDVTLENEIAEPVLEVPDDSGEMYWLIQKTAAKLNLLKYVDSYGLLLLNHLQASDALIDIQLLISLAEENVEHTRAMNLLLAIRQLLERMITEKHLYLRIEGE